MGETITADTLLIFDEVQAAPNALTALKFFQEQMPEVIAGYAENKDFVKVRKIQNKILKDYDRDFAKYATPLLATNKIIFCHIEYFLI
ncbi:hypothetical protein FACS1894177_05140 [Bacteroidia bacterium]|nr:hypothetical protein FACS1894177_05140 [Bacteroidia bacterium]